MHTRKCTRTVHVHVYIKCFISLVGMSRMDRVRNEEVHSRARMEKEFAIRADQRILSGLGM